MQEYEEKRHVTRIQTDCGMHFRYVGIDKVFEGHCVNISGTGILFRADREIPLGRALEIRTLPVCRSTPPVIAFVEVIRCARENHGFRIAGMIRGIKG
jgi:hypothetical protein